MWVLWAILGGTGFFLIVCLYDWLTQKEFVAEARIIHKSVREAQKDFLWHGMEGGSSFLFDQLSRAHYYLHVEFEKDGKVHRGSLPLAKAMHEEMPEGGVVMVRCAKGKVFGTRIKGLA